MIEMHLKVELCFKILMFTSDSLLLRMTNGPLFDTDEWNFFYYYDRNQHVFNLQVTILVIGIQTASYWLGHFNPPV